MEEEEEKEKGEGEGEEEEVDTLHTVYLQLYPELIAYPCLFSCHRDSQSVISDWSNYVLQLEHKNRLNGWFTFSHKAVEALITP